MCFSETKKQIAEAKNCIRHRHYKRIRIVKVWTEHVVRKNLTVTNLKFDQMEFRRISNLVQNLNDFEFFVQCNSDTAEFCWKGAENYIQFFETL